MTATFVYERTPRAKRTPPPQRAKVLSFIRAELDAARCFPSREAIARHMGWKNAQSSRDALLGLLHDGHVRRVPPAFTAWELVP